MYYHTPSIGELFVAFLLGAAIGALFSDRLRPIRKYVAYVIGLILLILAFKVHIPGLPQAVLFIAGLVVAIKLLADKLVAQNTSAAANVYGDAAWADLDHLQQNGMLEALEIVGGER